MVRRLGGGLCATLVVAVGIALSACGDGGDDDAPAGADGEGGAIRAADGSAPPSAAGSDREQIERVFRRLMRYYLDGDGESYCALLVASERRKVEEFGRSAGYGPGCSRTIAEASEATQAGGIPGDLSTPKRLTIRVAGTRARVTVRDQGGPSAEVGFARTAGGWKVSESGFEADPLAADALGGG